MISESGYYQQLRPIPFYNDSGETIPPFGIMKITGLTVVNGNKVYTVSKPDTTFDRFYLVNNHIAVDYQRYGTGNDGRYTTAAVDWSGAGGYGASPDSWELVKNRYGFTLLEVPTESGNYKVIQEPPFLVFGKTVSSIAGNASGAVNIHVNSATVGPWTAVTGYNDFADAGETIAGTTEAWLIWSEPTLTWQILRSSGGGSGEYCSLLTTYADSELLDTAKEWVIKLKYVSSAWTCVAVEVETACT